MLSRSQMNRKYVGRAELSNLIVLRVQLDFCTYLAKIITINFNIEAQNCSTVGSTALESIHHSYLTANNINLLLRDV